MKYSKILFISIVLTTPALAKHKQVAFTCPDESVLLETWANDVQAALPEDTSAAAKARALVYNSYFPDHIPNHDLLFKSVTLNKVPYDLTLVRSDYYYFSDYPDAYAVVFEKGTSKALATISTDTDRATYDCTPL